MWVRAMETYDRVAKVVGPKKEALAIAEAEYAEARSGPGPRARSGAVGPNNGTSFFHRWIWQWIAIWEWELVCIAVNV